MRLAIDMSRCCLAVSWPLAAWLAWSSVWINNGSRTRTSDRARIAAEHGNSRAKLGTTKGDHVLADVNGDLLTLMVMGVHQDPLDEVVAILIASDVDEWDAWTIRASSGDDSKVPIQELKTTNLQTLLDDLGSELVDAVAV